MPVFFFICKQEADLRSRYQDIMRQNPDYHSLDVRVFFNLLQLKLRLCKPNNYIQQTLKPKKCIDNMLTLLRYLTDISSQTNH